MAPTLDVNPLVQVDNAAILNAIRAEASPAYQARIPEADKASVQQNLRDLTNYRPAWNEFQEALINRIGMVIARNRVWTNPLAKFKRGLLEYGDTIEEIMTGLVKARRYNSDRESLERDLFGTHKVDTQASYHKVNREDKYMITTNEALLKRAFLDSNGLQAYVTSVLTSPTTSDQWDEFLLITSLFREFYEVDGFFKIQVPDVSNLDSDAPDAKAFLRRVRETATVLPFLSSNYNPAGMPAFANPDELELFITPAALAAIDVEALAGAFNIEKASMPGRITVIPEEYWRIPGAQAILTVRDFFVIADQLLETTSMWNPAQLQTNFFLHHWEVISASRFVPVVLFTTEPGTVIDIIDNPVTSVGALSVVNSEDDVVTSVVRGMLYQILGEAVTTPTGGDNTALRLVVSGNLSSRTRVTQDGVLHVGYDEAADTLVVTAYAVDSENDADGQISATESLNVVGDLLTLWPSPNVQTDSDDDNLFEVTPDALTMDADTGNVVIPTVAGVQYKKAGTNVNNGTTQNVPASSTVVFTAVARTHNEIAAGATVSWSFTRA